MNDFLHSLRTNKDKRYDKSRRNYDSPSYRQNDRMNNSERKRKNAYRPQQNEQTQAYAAINKLLPTIKTLLESQNDDRKKLIVAEERKAAAMESIASLLKQLSGGAADALPVLESIESFCENDACEPVKDETTHVPEEAGLPAEEQKLAAKTEKPAEENAAQGTKQNQDLVSMVKGLRAQGYSYEKIARHLEENNIPTVSGRGKWRGQAVSKLCQ